jgi:putative ATPase
MESTYAYRPLADRMRPSNLAEFVGQEHLLAPGKPLRQAIEEDRLHSMVFWGPPGTGKTTLARILATASGAEFVSLSAVLAGVKEIREAVAKAKRVREEENRYPMWRTVRSFSSGRLRKIRPSNSITRYCPG